MTDQTPQEALNIGTGEQAALSWSIHQRRVTMHLVFDEEIATLRAVGPTTALTFFGISVGGLLGMLGILLTQKHLTTDSHAAILGLMVLSAVLAGFFAIIAGVGYWRLHRLVGRIRERPAPHSVES